MKKAFRRAEGVAIVLVSSLFAFGLPQAQAQSTVVLTDPLGGSESFTSVATAVAGFLFWDVAVPLSVIMVLVGAFQLMSSAGDPEKVAKGRKTITYAAVGLAVALLAGGAAKFIQSFVTG